MKNRIMPLKAKRLPAHAEEPRPEPVLTEPVSSERNGKPAEADIRLRAYQKWEAAGRPTGDGIQFWLQAERELLQV